MRIVWGTIALTWWVSLVPFQFAWPGLDHVWATVATRWEWGITSRANFIANTLLLVPLGFCGAGAHVQRRSPRLATGQLALVCVLAVGVAGVAELLQVFTPGRTPSGADVVAQTLGAIAGVVAWLMLRHEVYTWASHVTARRASSAIVMALCGYGALYSLGQLLPLDVTVSLSNLAAKYRQGGIVIDPMKGLHRPDFVQSFVSQVAVTTPLGSLLYLALRRSATRAPLLVAVTIGAAWATALEGAQVLVMSRVADIWDVIAAVMGGVVGAAAVVTLVATDDRVQGIETRKAQTANGDLWATLWMMLAAGLYAAYNLSPFDFTRPADASSRVAALFRVPFLAYYEAEPLEALRGGVLKILLGVPVGISAAFGTRRLRSAWPRTILTLLLVGGGLFFSVVEAGQALLPSRYPDSTDVVLATFGFVAGILAVAR